MAELEEKPIFRQWHEDYYVSTDNKEKLNLRNAIVLELIPLIEQSIGKFNNLSIEYREDLFQELTIKVMTDYVEKWKPTNGSIEGYYRKCLFRGILNWLEVNKKERAREILIDPKDAYYWETVGKTEHVILVHNDFEFDDSSKQDVYKAIISLMERGGVEGTRDELLRELAGHTDLFYTELKRIYDHALVTCRENHLNKASNKVQQIDSETFFGRMVKYLEDEQVKAIIKVFGGCNIKIPVWED